MSFQKVGAMRQVHLLVVFYCVGVFSNGVAFGGANMVDRQTDRQKAQTLFAQKNYAEALQVFRTLVDDPANNDSQLPTDYLRCVECLKQINQVKDYDGLHRSAIEAHPNNWRLKLTAAQVINNDTVPHDGFLIGGEFERGPHRGGGTYVSCYVRDRVEALQLLGDAVRLMKDDLSASAKEKSDVWFVQANLVGDVRRSNTWRLQDLTDLDTLPDYEKGGSDRGRMFSAGYNRRITPRRGGGLFSVPTQFGRGFGMGNNTGAPIGEDDNPIFHQLPASWEAARSDGERWRWALEQSAVEYPARRSEVDLQWAGFLKFEFGVVTESAPVFGTAPEGEEMEQPEWRLHELKDTETVAQLADGARKITLADEFNHLTVLKNVIARNDKSKTAALEEFADVRMNRHQYPQAAELFDQLLALAKPPEQKKSYQEQIDQIRGNWVQFQTTRSQTADRGARLSIQYRNGAAIEFTAYPVKIEALLNDVKSYLQSNPKQMDGQKIQIERIGFRLVNQNETKYLGTQIASWQLPLQPAANHFDTATTVSTPLQKPGAYLLKGKMADGNEARIVIWVADTAITRKRVESGTLTFISDAITGKPIANASLEFFGYRQLRNNKTRQVTIETSRAADRTDNDGLCIRSQAEQSQMRWLTVARTADGRLAYDGFARFWTPQPMKWRMNGQAKVFAITDRPVYRPEHTVKYRMWVRQPRFDDDAPRYANQNYILQLRDPKNEIVFEKPVTTDRWAGLDGTYQLADGAQLGTYRLLVGAKVKQNRTQMQNGQRKTIVVEQFRQLGMGAFQVEEYRKPEFKVTVDVPDTPIKLGETIQAKVTATYFFGAPVTEATVKYKVNRLAKNSRWFPTSPWDWLYSPGYWWFASDYNWYPNWTRWGCAAPTPNWQLLGPAETVLKGEAQIGADGTVLLEIDTASALKEHGDSDHRYNISAEVVDQSRRTILGVGNVLVARSAFNVFVWPDKGYYTAGDTIDVGIQARTSAGKSVAGNGKATLYALKYNDGKPVETRLEAWDVVTTEDGRSNVRMVVPKSGQYRISVSISDESGNVHEGGYVVFVKGPNENGSDYRFNKLELTTQQRDYSPGETVKLLVSTDKIGSTVLLFVRSLNGIAAQPQVLRLKGKTTELEIPITKADTPNILIEALTISDGRLHSAMKEVFVPPEERVANVDVLPSSQKYRPGQEAVVRLKLTGLDGKPFVGDTVVSVYDASLEDIAAGSIPEIRSFFWKVRRQHRIANQTTLSRYSYPVSLPNEREMADLGNAMVTWGGGFGGGGFGGGGGVFGGVQGRSLGRSSGMAAPMAMAMGSAPESADDAMTKSVSRVANAEGPIVEPSIRSNFADTAYWVASTTSDADGVVEVRFTVPDNLTTWKIKAWTLGDGTRVGSGTSEIISSKDLIIRPQTPRFFTQKDQITLSAVVHNYLETAKSTKVALEVEGGQLQILTDVDQTVAIPAGGEVRVDWGVKVVASGPALVRMKALTDEESDATEFTVPCNVHGILKTESFAGVIRPDGNSADFTINVPAERIEEQSRLEVRFSPTLAGAMVDALPYLIDYPYGCTEQTLNRFVPAMLTQKTLVRMGVNLADIQLKRTNLNAQEIGDPAVRAQQWKRFDRNPVFDKKELQKIVKAGVTELSNMQLSDGGWGWFSGYRERSSAHLTAQVIHGLILAENNNVAVLPDVVDRGLEWLKKHQQIELAKLREGDFRKQSPDELQDRKQPFKTSASNLDAFVAFVLSEPDAGDPAMNAYLYRDRGALSVYAKALTGLVFDFQHDNPKRDMLLRNIEQSLVTDDENQTAYLNMGTASWWNWYGNENEAMARYLQLLLKAAPQSETAPKLVKYLLNNRKHGTYWDSTRDTAVVVEALADYITATGEGQPDMTVEVLVDGQLQKRVRINADNLFSFDNVMLLEGDAVSTGGRKVEIRRTGTGPVYFNAYLTNFTQEDNIAAAGLEVKVQRRFYKLQPNETEASVRGDRGQVVRQSTADFKRIPLDSFAEVASGDLIEVELLIDSKNDYEYLLLQDRKPSGFETDDQRSGYFNSGLRAYRELRDDRVSFFLNRLARGNHSLSYRIRAEAPGQKLSALPAKIEGMYAPELVGNSSEFTLRVADE